MRTIQEDFREYAHLDRQRTGDGLTPVQYRRWRTLRERLDAAFGSRRPAGRNERRASLRVPIRLRAVYDAASGLEGTATQLSRTGCFVRTEVPAAVGTNLTLVLAAGTAGALEVPAQVVSHNGSRGGAAPGMGLRFRDPSAATRKQLDALYEAVEAEGAA